MKSNQGSLNMRIPRHTFRVASTKRKSAPIDVKAHWIKALAGSLLGAYLLRITIPGVWLDSISPFVVNFGGYVALAAAAVYLLAQNLRTNTTAILLAGCVVLTVFFSMDIGTAMGRSFLWLLVFIVVGPLLSGFKARLFREMLWRWHKLAMVAVAVLSFLWYTARLPEYGKGVSGVTVHCMLLGPFAALAVIYATVKTIETKSYKYGFISAISLLTCFVSGSRSAALGAVVALAVIPILRLKSQTLRWTSVFLLLCMAFFVRSAFNFDSLDGSPVFKADNPLDRYVAQLQQKGMENTRAELWDMRWAEFESSPIAGLGIGVESSGGSRTGYGTTVIEPGSSYLAVLSMTGITGALGLLGLFLTLLVRVRKKWTIISSTDRTEIAAAGIFWAVHAVAEGWIFAGGSILCLFFWLWVGRLSSLGTLIPGSSPTP
jgi:O-Antigen ligase